jgi:hypothetical protein
MLVHGFPIAACKFNVTQLACHSTLIGILSHKVGTWGDLRSLTTQRPNTASPGFVKLADRFLQEYTRNASLIRLGIIRMNDVRRSNLVCLSECLIKAVHLRELHIASVFDDDGNLIWLNAMRQNGSLHCVSWPDNGGEKDCRGLLHAQSHSVQLPGPVSAVERRCRRDQPRRLDPFPPGLGLCLIIVVSRM